MKKRIIFAFEFLVLKISYRLQSDEIIELNLVEQYFAKILVVKIKLFKSQIYC